MTRPDPTIPATIRVGGAGDHDAGGYDVVVGTGLAHTVADHVPATAETVLLAHSPQVPDVVTQVAHGLRDAGYRVVLHAMPDGEAGKTIDAIAHCWDVLGLSGFTRSDAIVAVGGGAVTDAAGYVAASWLRGVAVVQVPTTLLGMVDAAVGGKTGINTAQGKNLVGAFHPPAAVICDLATLATLPRRDVLAGLAEVVKAGFIADPTILDIVQSHPAHEVTDPTSPALLEVARRAIQVKADVVSQDLREASLREILNYGHTYAHAIEVVEDFHWRHGDAVSVGMVYAAELGRLAGRTPADLVALHRSVLGGLGLPTRYPDSRWDQLRAAMGRDKKARGATLRFVVLTDLAAPDRLTGPSEDLLRQAAALTRG